MNNNRLLDAGVLLCKVSMAVTAMVFLAATLVLIHLYTVPELYDGVHFKGVFIGQGIFNWNSINEITIEGQEPGDRFALSKIESFSIFINYIQVSVFLLFTVLILRQFMVVIRSVREHDLLARSNAFSKVARYLLVIFFVTSFTFVDAPLGHYSNFTIRFIPLLFVLGAYLLANMLRKEHVRMQAQRAV